MTHRNASLTPRGRLKLARLVVDDGWSMRRAAERFQCATATAKTWADRYRTGGAAAMEDRSSRPARCPHRTPTRTERRIIKVRFLRRWGPHRIAFHLRMPRSTVYAVLRRYKMPPLTHLDQATGLPVRRTDPRRYEHDNPGDLVHIDIKKLGRIPDGGGHRKFGRTIGNRHNKQKGRGYAYLHHMVDDHSRLAYSEQLGDERKETAAAFYERGKAAFATLGITIRAVLTDCGSCYRSHYFNNVLGTVTHRYTRPYRPQTNGKVERFNRTLATEWAYARTYLSDDARAATYQAWIHHYNHHRPHFGIGGQSPIDRVTVHNVPGNYS